MKLNCMFCSKNVNDKNFNINHNQKIKIWAKSSLNQETEKIIYHVFRWFWKYLHVAISVIFLNNEKINISKMFLKIKNWYDFKMIFMCCFSRLIRI
jgi:hypothetical protein